MIELLKEAARELGAVQYYIPPADETVEMVPAITADVDACQKLAKRIDDVLAEPAPDAKAIAERIEQEMCGIEGEPGNESVVLDIDRATALIESRRVVPRAMLDDIIFYTAGMMDWNGEITDRKFIDKIAEAHGYKVEG